MLAILSVSIFQLSKYIQHKWKPYWQLHNNWENTSATLNLWIDTHKKKTISHRKRHFKIIGLFLIWFVSTEVLICIILFVVCIVVFLFGCRLSAFVFTTIAEVNKSTAHSTCVCSYDHRFPFLCVCVCWVLSLPKLEQDGGNCVFVNLKTP